MISIEERTQRWSKGLALACLGLVVLGFIGWQFRVPWLIRPAEHFTPVNPISAVEIALVSICGLIWRNNRKTLQGATIILSSAAIVLGLVRLWQRMGLTPFRIDRVLYANIVSNESSWVSSQSPATAVCIVLLALGVLFLFFERASWAQVLAVIVAFVSWLAILGHIYRVPEFYSTSQMMPMSLYTAIGVILLAGVIFTADTNAGMAREVFGIYHGSKLGRVLLPTVFIVPMLLGYIKTWAYLNDLFSTEFSAAWLIVTITIFIGAIAVRTIIVTNEYSRKQRAFEDELLHLNDELHKKHREVNKLATSLSESNAELMALNEQMTSTNEELNALNDQLTAANATIRRQSESNLNAIFEATVDGLLLLDVNRAIVTFNSKQEAFSKLPLKTGVDILSLVTPERRDTFADYLNRAQRGETVSYELSVGSGLSQEAYQVAIAGIRYEGHHLGFCITTTDLTQLRRGEVKLSERERWFKAIMDNSDEMYSLSKPTGEVLFVSPSFTRHLGYSSEDMKTLQAKDIIHPDDLPRYAAWRKVAVESPGVLMHSPEARFKHKDGHWVWIDGTLINLFHIAGVNGMVGTMHDITKRHNQQEEQDRLLRQLISSNNDLLQFSFIASHNLRGPVASIQGLLNLLNVEDIKGESVLVFNMIRQSVNRLDTVIKDLTSILQIRSTSMNAKEVVRYDEVLSAIQIDLHEQLKESGGQLAIDLSASAEIYSVRSYMQSIFYNLISNAIKFRSPNRRLVITVKSFRNEHNEGFSVTDNGTGLDLDKFGDKIFGLYHRFHLQTEGKGLGLYMTRAQVSALNGKITLESRVNEGATFTVSFPIVENFG